MSGNDEDAALPLIRRKLKNLAYFQKYRPEIYQYFAEFEPSHCELIVTPGRDDVDLLDSGRSVYRHLAREYSESEVQKFLDNNPPEKPIVTMRPPFHSGGEHARFASRYVAESVANSKITPESFRGYYRGEVLPSVVFLGCGLGYHIDFLTSRADVIDAVVFEPDAERFALTLFTVDWEEICKRFRGKGRAISFCIATEASEENVRRVLGKKMAEIVPLYPFFSWYYNHLANVELFRIAKDLEKDLPVVGANWGNYDFELRGLRNVYHNVRLGGRHIRPFELEESNIPVAIVGSGPSIDNRIESLKASRDKLIVISAGTGLRALLNHGVRPDFHVELDADYMIYEMLTDIDQQFGLHGITLLSTISVNPLVPPLFEDFCFYFSSEYYIPAFLGFNDYAIPGCSPTCTNAALALAFAYGFRNIFLFGTDYGYQDKAQHHSRFSVYGEESKTEFATSFRKDTAPETEARPKFETEGVNGTTVITQGDYFSAKRAAERYLEDRNKQGLTYSVRNCSDGALINGAEWLSEADFMAPLTEISVAERKAVISSVIESAQPMPFIDRKQIFSSLAKEIKDTSKAFLSMLRDSRLSGRKDLIVVCNQIRDYLNRVGPGSGRRSPVIVQMMGWQILKGSVQRFLQTGLCHGLAHRDEDLQGFLDQWGRAFREFLEQLPEHFASVMLSDLEPAEDPWIVHRLMDPRPDKGK
ncbi:MAG: 6-hydroxymethylpterin diphosphokinase MptE-like protein [Pseudomonadota bacterium]|nr:6-hydroxymethylpterin diphosphokinase MptE-like protein [Pseudomonadota bacterium]